MRPVMLVATRLATFDLRRYLVGALLWLPVHVIPLAGGLVLQQVFDQISGHQPAALRGTLWWCAAFVGVELVRGLVIVVAWTYGVYWWSAAATLLRANVLRSVLTARGPVATRVPHSSGEAVARLRDDVADAVDFTDESVTLAGTTLFAAAALPVLASVDPVITLVLALPMIAIGVLSRTMRRTVARLHRRSRRLGAAVTAYVGEVFGGVLALKTAGAEAAALERLREHNRRRRDAAVRDRMATDLLGAATTTTIELSIGLVLLLAAPAMRGGEFTVGDLALFTSYIGWLTALPRSIGTILYRLPQAAVATERLTGLLAPHEDAGTLSGGAEVWLHRDPPPAAPPPRHADPLRVLEARGLSVRGVLHGVDLRVERGSFTVITGAVGAGKTTLVRALLGLLPLDEGTLSWNGAPVGDPGTFLVPGRTAYASQVPRLFSATLRENLLLGLPAGDDDARRALELAAFEQDLAGMPDGLGTVVGPRGVRLSGGQVQRATAARALVREPDLLVVDDLSSALDVETEQLLWERIAGRGPGTVLVVSHRQAALERADQVIVLDRGRVAGRGRLEELLESCPEMRRLWHAELIAEAEEQTGG
ncbi:ATP-binding cassette subfamily B protein [Nonomuraea thailandensis]|uniref:ATP-binding cassette subfamily B protein n=1 Tax=Nonomuraea thailandensis TaxID=1188745 RepID=A0A9X2K0U3_9ACTN|nr:ABC transporter ATP-binding protein [Nonomuraea thailandensis]MCP2355300.1 ATP-binding cassette subfamily B protein [Nonomuraea thailandensis]